MIHLFQREFLKARILLTEKESAAAAQRGERERVAVRRFPSRHRKKLHKALSVYNLNEYVLDTSVFS